MRMSVLLADDDKNICRTLALSLAEADFSVVVCHSVDEALDELRKTDFDLILTDYRMGEKTGKDLVLTAQKTFSIPVVVMTAYSSIENAVDVVRAGAFDYLSKPFSQIQLMTILDKVRKFVLERRRLQDLKNSKVRNDLFDGYKSPVLQITEKFIRTVAATKGTVLLTGETGTGKSEIAKLVHELSPRSAQPFITVFCSTLTESLVESELFGHVKGAFTNAVKDKPGKLELAHKGTLFLDEIGDLSISSQAKLLRFLQDRVFERVGSNEEILIDARIIAATHKNLPDLVAQGKFREDLYYRLNSLECFLNPLRERSEDIPALINHLISELRQRENHEKEWSLPEQIVEIFKSYSWPGNIRELKNVIERMFILSFSKDITILDLPKAILDSLQETAEFKNDGDKKPLSSRLKDLEKDHIEKILSYEKNLEKASSLLGITPVTLWRKRKQYGLA